MSWLPEYDPPLLLLLSFRLLPSAVRVRARQLDDEGLFSIFLFFWSDSDLIPGGLTTKRIKVVRYRLRGMSFSPTFAVVRLPGFCGLSLL